MLPRGSQYNLRNLGHMLPVLDLCYLDPAQPLATTGEELDDLDHDLSGLPFRGTTLSRS